MRCDAQGWTAFRRAAADLPVEEGYVLAPFDPAWSAKSARPAQRGRVEAVAIADRAEAPMQQIAAPPQAARAVNIPTSANLVADLIVSDTARPGLTRSHLRARNNDLVKATQVGSCG